MFITEQNGAQMWTKILKENFNVTDSEKLQWVSEYAAAHEIFESNIGLGGASTFGNGVLNANNGLNPIYATPLNTLGMGNPTAPGDLPNNTMAPGDFFKQQVGSGDIPVSTLPMALNIALMTVGLELLPVVNAKGPWTLLSYMDFPYAGGKLGRRNEIASLDGIGDGAENKPLYVKILGIDDAQRAAVRDAGENATIVISSATNGTLTGTFKSFGRMDGGLIIQVKEATKTEGEGGSATTSNVSIMSIFAGNDAKNMTITAAAEGAEAVSKNLTGDAFMTVDFAQTMVDFIDGFANFATGAKEPMTRAQNETGTGNVIGLRLFSKWVQMGSYEVTGTVTRQQLQDLPLYGVDAVAKIMESLQNEITQNINRRILDHVFALGVTNAVNQRAYQNIDLNLYMGTAANKLMSATHILNYTDIFGVDHKGDWGAIVNAEVNTSAENLHTRQRRIASRMLAAANFIQTTGRRGRATWAITNTKVATALQDVSSYVVTPMVNNLAQDGSQNLYLGGKLAGLNIYVDPYMDWEDTRICVGRKGNGNEPGAIFMPYILADTVSITAEGTMVPKVLVNSRYTIADAGFYPETQYYTFMVDCDFDII
jgi:hypothetical protein